MTRLLDIIRRPAHSISGLVAVLTMGILLVGLTGCGDDSAPAGDSAASSTEEPIRAPFRSSQPAIPDFSGMGYTRGAEDAPVTVVEFSDFGCPYCAQFARETYPELAREFVETGQVRWRYIPFVLGIFPNGAQAALASECAADQDQFWPMHDLLFEQQSAWRNSSSVAPLLVEFAEQIGLDSEAFRRCYSTQAPGTRLALQTALAEQLGIRATPTFIVNGRPLQGALPLDRFRQFLQWSGAAGDGAGIPEADSGS